MIVCLLQYGWHGKRALIAAINERIRDDIWRNYMASVAYSIGKIASGFGGGEYPLPTYYELLHKDEPPADDRTGKEIISDLIKRLGEGGNDATI